MKNSIKKNLQIILGAAAIVVAITVFSLQEGSGNNPFGSNGNVLTQSNSYAKTNTGKSSNVQGEVSLSDEYFMGGKFSLK